MFYPEIHWHYYGKLRESLENLACEAQIKIIIDAVRTSPLHKLYIVIPLNQKETEIFKDILRNNFNNYKMKVYATNEKGERCGVSTSYDQEDANYNFSLYCCCLANAKTQIKINSVFSGFSKIFSKSSPPELIVILLNPIERDFPIEIPTQTEIESLNQLAIKNKFEIKILERIWIDREKLFKALKILPSKILNQSHKWEKALLQRVNKSPESSPDSFLLKALWKALETDQVQSILSLKIFQSRKQEIAESLLKIYPWEAIFSLWEKVLYDLESDREYADRWYRAIKSKSDGKIYLEDIHDVSLYENSIYCLHCENDPKCLIYPIVYHGSRWLQERIALATFFGSFGGAFGGVPKNTWEED